MPVIRKILMGTLFLMILFLPVSHAQNEGNECSHEGIIDRKCLTEKYEKESNSLQERYGRILTQLKGLKSSETGDRREVIDLQTQWLTKSQGLWKEYREARCQESYYKYYPGSLALPSRLWCLIELTERRNAELKTLYE